MKIQHTLNVVTIGLLIIISTPLHAVTLNLEGRLPLTSGGNDYQAYYDPNLDITWAASQSVEGIGYWDDAVLWASNLSINGISGWRLPDMDRNNDGTVVDCTGGGVSGCSDNEYGYLYWEEGITSATPSPFNNFYSLITGRGYWSGTEQDAQNAWAFDFGVDVSHVGGTQFYSGKIGFGAHLAVIDGDVSAVPIPFSIWLFSSGLLGLVSVASRKKAPNNSSNL